MKPFILLLMLSWPLSSSVLNGWAVTYQCNPQHQVLIDKTVEILIQEQQARSQEGYIMEVHLTFGHMSDL